MFRIDDPSAATSLPAPEAAGTEGFWTEGSPASGTPATLERASWFNMIQEELRAVVVAGGLTPSKTTYTQVRDAILAQMLIASGMNCQLAYNGTNLVLSRYKGRYAYIPGSGAVTIPTAGITLAPSGLTANTLYYIYLSLVSGTPTLVASTTGHSTDSSTGVEIMTGDNTKILVGMERAASATTWQGLCRSWYNDPGFATSIQQNSNGTTTSTTYVELTTGLRTGFLCWPSETVNCAYVGSASNASAGISCTTGLAIDGTTAINGFNASGSGTAALGSSVNCSNPVAGLAEGYHYLTVLARVGGGTGTWVGSATPGVANATFVAIAPRK